jgi:hypothetical protein
MGIWLSRVASVNSAITPHDSPEGYPPLLVLTAHFDGMSRAKSAPIISNRRYSHPLREMPDVRALIAMPNSPQSAKGCRRYAKYHFARPTCL